MDYDLILRGKCGVGQEKKGEEKGKKRVEE